MTSSKGEFGMTYQDTWAACTKCGKQFVFRVEEQRRQVNRGEEITPPELCPSCRAPARVERPPEPREPSPKPVTEQKAEKPEPDFPDGTRVTYLIEQTEKGPQAVDVERMDVEAEE
jgi:hypothetical protein